MRIYHLQVLLHHPFLRLRMPLNRRELRRLVHLIRLEKLLKGIKLYAKTVPGGRLILERLIVKDWLKKLHCESERKLTRGSSA